MPCTEPSASLIRVAHRLGPQAERLQLLDEVAIDLRKSPDSVSRLNRLRHLRLDALVAAGDRRDGRGRRDRDHQRVAQARAAGSARATHPSARDRRVRRPSIELQLAAAARVSSNAGCCPSLARARPTPSARGSRSPRRSSSTAARASAASNGSRSWKKTSCRPMTPRPTGRQRRFERCAVAIG